MIEPKPSTVEDAALRVYPDLPCHVADDEAVRAAVRAGIDSFEVGPTFDLATVRAELRDMINGEG